MNQLLADLIDTKLGHGNVSATLLGKQIVAGEDRRLATFDGNVH